MVTRHPLPTGIQRKKKLSPSLERGEDFAMDKCNQKNNRTQADRLITIRHSQSYIIIISEYKEIFILDLYQKG